MKSSKIEQKIEDIKQKVLNGELSNSKADELIKAWEAKLNSKIVEK